jgi:hypothetical protein
MSPRSSILIRCAIGSDLAWVNLSHPLVGSGDKQYPSLLKIAAPPADRL